MARVNRTSIDNVLRARRPAIPRVPLLLRQDERNHDAYDPKVVSFGPYHHGKEELQYCQKAKHLALQLFWESSTQSCDFFYQRVLDVIRNAREYYHEGSTDMYTDNEFADMMLLDACFLIAIMGIGSPNPNNMFPMLTYTGRLAFYMIHRDIILLENQIPFQILTLLVDLRYGDPGREDMSRFLHRAIWGHYRQEPVVQIWQHLRGQYQPLSLLDAFHKVLTWDRPPEVQSQHSIINEEERHPTKRFKTYRSASDLKAKGIHFSASHQRSLEDVQFKSCLFYGNLELPVWHVSDLSRVFFPNMIAYELCPGLPHYPIVISYVNFMKSLIDEAADVKLMRNEKILLTSLGDDEEVATFFKDLKTYGWEETPRFKDVRGKIQMHYDSTAKTWMAEFVHIYFNRPWTIIASISAVVLLALTAVQTYYRIHSHK